MAKFNKTNFKRIIYNIESMEMHHENIWVPIGVLEMMYEDDIGYIDRYFHTDRFDRDKEKLWYELNKKFDE